MSRSLKYVSNFLFTTCIFSRSSLILSCRQVDDVMKVESNHRLQTFLGSLHPCQSNQKPQLRVSPSWCSRAPSSVLFFMSYSWIVSSLLPVATNLSLAAAADMEAVWAWCVKSASLLHSCNKHTQLTRGLFAITSVRNLGENKPGIWTELPALEITLSITLKSNNVFFFLLLLLINMWSQLPHKLLTSDRLVYKSQSRAFMDIHG